MTPVIEGRAKELAVPSDTELQRPEVPPREERFPQPADVPCGRDGGPDGAEITVTAYLSGDFRERPDVIAGRRVVRSLDPERWPHPPEPDCQKEWDELGS